MSEYIITSKELERLEIPTMFTEQEIVRCRDCRYYDPNDEPSKVYPDRYWCDLMANYLHPDGFCAWGERVIA